MNFQNKTTFLLFFTFFLFPFILFSQQIDENKALQDFQIIESQNRFVESLNIGSGEQEGKVYNLPIGIKKNIGNIPITVAITNVKFGREYGEATVIMKMCPTHTSKTMVFGAVDVPISYGGDLIGDITLALLSDIPVSLGNLGDLTFKGGFDGSTGTSTSKTYVSLDCNGNFKELSADAQLVLNKNTFKLAGKETEESVTASFRTVISDWNDLFINLDFPTFEIKGADGFEFQLSNATLDLSDSRNPDKFNPDPSYFAKHFTLPDRDLWRGLYVENFSVTFPEWFKKKNSTERIVLEASHLLIDDNGITGDIIGRNILSFEQGDASGWAFSVTDFQLSFLANTIKGFGFAGEIDVPLSETSQPRAYEAYISKDEYLFKVGMGLDIDCNIFGAAKLKLDPTSYLQVELKDKKFNPRVVLNGSMGFDRDGLKIEELTFTKLALGTQAPIFSVESLGYGGEIKFGKFPISVSDIRASLTDKQASIGLNVHVNLMKDRISASSRIILASERRDEHWKFQGVSIDGLELKNVQMAGFTLSGHLQMEKNHPVYGEYFGGDIKATFGALSNALEVDVTSVFGCTDYRYWYVEGKANFKRGIPVGPAFTINGFMGGAYYRMAATGKTGMYAYEPDDRSSLGVKAGVSYGAAGGIIEGNALFEMNFLSSGGIRNMHFYATAELFAGVKAWIEVEGLDDFRKKVSQKSKFMSESLTAALPSNMSGSDAAKDVLVSVQLGVGINAYATIDYDFLTKVFDANFSLRVSSTGNFIRGVGPNNTAGEVKLHFSPNSWYVHAGTPKTPIGLKIGLGPISLDTKSYIMLGDKLENPVAPPQALLDILRITPEKADYMKYPAEMKAGRGVAFGSSFSFDTGDITFLILYARFMAGAGLDVMLRDMSGYSCEGQNKQIGLSGWYANGQVYTYLSGELGVKVKLFFIKKRITIIKGAAGALLQARIPNPTWIGGRLGVKLNILGGLVKANMSMKMSFGDDCKLVSLNGDNSPIDMPMISDLSPLTNDTDVDVFISPQATFNMSMDKPFEMLDDNGDVREYRIRLGEFYITDNNQKIDGKIKWNTEKNVATFESKEILPPYKNLKVFVSVNFEEKVNGAWKIVSQNGQVSRESRESAFKTGGAPNYIPLTNIEYCYPVISQKNFFKNESSSGYVQLKKGQSYLFPQNFAYNVLFTLKNGSSEKVAFTYNQGNSSLTYQFPNLKNETEYAVSFVASTIAQNQNSAPVIQQSTTQITDGEGEAFSINYMEQAAQKIIKDGSMEVLAYGFRSSKYNTFEQKIASISFNPTTSYISTDVRSLILPTNGPVELFDFPELTGSDYTTNVPLVSLEAILDDDYYTQDIAPLIYNWYPISGMTITTRDINEYGVPPVKAFPVYRGYLNYLTSATRYNADIAENLPFEYSLPYYYKKDYHDLYTKLINSFDKPINLSSLENLRNSSFPFVRRGTYKAIIKYTLPGGRRGTSKQIEFKRL